MTTLQTTNLSLGLPDHSTEATTPTTPRAPGPPSAHPVHVSDRAPPGPETPSHHTIGGLTGQRPLPRSPFERSVSTSQHIPPENKTNMLDREEALQSTPSAASQDVEMGEDSDGDDGASDAESVDAEGRPSKKKKGQRFFCMDFPPCKLSFTRSEHLARHIRKHTGERPFQCHCSRRFSRLDNLRQHAQTVHVNEEIPGDSLAATGTRFQRQIRTDRVAGGRTSLTRPRTSSNASAGMHSRGHSRNLSASSITSTPSTMSTISRDDSRRRPPPLMMASDMGGRNRLSLEVLRNGASTPPGQSSFYREESEGISTPTSTTFSTGQQSPGGYGSSLGSPASAVSRGAGFWDGRSHGRRLSVPSGPMPFQSSHNMPYSGSPYLSPLVSSSASHFSSSLGSPVNITHPPPPPPQSGLSAAEEWRRRTWHPSTNSYVNYSRPATSGLVFHQTPDAPRPAFTPPGAIIPSQTTNRLPGIETFDNIPRQPEVSTPHSSQMLHRDSASRAPHYPGQPAQLDPGPNDRTGHASWDMSLHQNLTKLDLGHNNSTAREQGSWMRPHGPRPSSEQMIRPTQSPSHTPTHENQKRPTEAAHYPTPTANRAKRQGWYMGPPPSNQPLQPTSQPRTSPGDSSSSEGLPTTPSLPLAEHRPTIVHSNGFVEHGQPQMAAAPNLPSKNGQQRPPGQSPALAWPLPVEPKSFQAPDTEMSGLEVLVAVATRDENPAAESKA